MPEFGRMELGYSNLWDRSKPTRGSEAVSIARKIFANKKRYKEIGDSIGVPYWTIGSKHYRESNLDFTTHLHCGDSLMQRTVHVPKGRPVSGSPPFTFEFSARDALTMAPHCLQNVRRWSLERTLYEDEKYNGWGYLGKGNSPYVWSGMSVYSGGKYVADHVYSAYEKDKQLGTAVIYVELAKLDPEVANGLKDRESQPASDAVDEQVKKQTEKEKRIGGAATAETAASSTTKATMETPDKFTVAHGILLPMGIGIGIAIMVVCLLSYLRKRKSVPVMVQEKWGQVSALVDDTVPKARTKNKKKKKSVAKKRRS